MQKRISNWQQIYKTLGKNQAFEFYIDNLHHDNQQRFDKQSIADGIKTNYDYLIITAGLIKHYYILLIDYIKPKNIIWISSDHFEKDYLPEILNNLTHKNFNQEVFSMPYDKITITSTYRFLKSITDKLENKNVLLEITAGKNIMSAGAGIMGCFKGFDICYIDVTWNSDLKTGQICSEKLVEIRNPLLVFGDYTAGYADALFNQGLYKSASALYQSLSKQVEDPRLFIVKNYMSDAYYAWDNFNYPLAKTLLEKALNTSKQYNFNQFTSVLKNNLDTLKILKDFSGIGTHNIDIIADPTKITYLLLDIYMSATKKLQTGLYDESILLFYRIIELISQHRLATYNISTSKLSKEIINKYNEKYSNLSMQVFGVKQSLQSELGVKNGHLLLFCLDDMLWQNQDLNNLKKLFDILKTRDHSFFAHGFAFNSAKTAALYQRTTFSMIKSLSPTINTLTNIQNYLTRIKFGTTSNGINHQADKF